ncbi:MAG: hypothetical protein HOY79_01620 [Streptomyces sp.]|nr:hypothetical protein [Streptomyces sp.]
MTASVYGATDKVSKSGDTMTGTLVINASNALQANPTTGTGVAVTGSTTGQTLASTTGADSTSNALAASVTGDAFDRVRLQVNGQLNIGPGTATRDTTVGRAATGVLYTPNTMLVGASSPLGDNGVGEMQLANAATAPTTAPTGGVAVFAQGGILKWIDTTGKVYDLSEFIASNLDNTNCPADQGLIAWTSDGIATGSANPASGGVRLGRIILRRAATITNIWLSVVTAGSGLASGQSFVGLYSPSGTQLGVSADQSTAFASAGVKQIALTSPYTAAAGIYYVALLTNATTPPAFAAMGPPTNSPANANLTVSTGRTLSGPSGQTALPASITMSGNAFNSTGYWFAVS